MIQHFTTTFLTKKPLTHNVWLFSFQLQNGQQIDFKAGQYLILKIGDQRRLYSISCPDSSKTSFEMVVEMIENGVGSNYLMKLKEGEDVYFQGPAGLFYLQTPGKNKIFLATGTGIAPIWSEINTLLESNEDKHTEIILFWGLKTMKDAYFIEELLLLSETHPNFKFFLCLTRETETGHFEKGHIQKGRIHEVLKEYYASKQGKLPKDIEYYVCGSREMVTSLQQFLVDNEVEKSNIIVEKF